MKYERKRARGKTLPRMLYRTAYENSATMSQFVTPDCLVKHRDVPELKLHEQNAFQNVGNFIATRDMTRLRIERQFKTQQKVDPSPFVSMYDSFRKCVFLQFLRGITNVGKRKLKSGHAYSITRVVLSAIVSTLQRSTRPI
jgi:hypothetical protein